MSLEPVCSWDPNGPQAELKMGSSFCQRQPPRQNRNISQTRQTHFCQPISCRSASCCPPPGGHSIRTVRSGYGLDLREEVQQFRLRRPQQIVQQLEYILVLLPPCPQDTG